MGDSYDQKQSAMMNVYNNIQPACFEQILYARAMMLHHAIIHQIQNSSINANEIDITTLVRAQLHLLYNKKEQDYVFYEEGAVSDFSKRDIGQYHELIKQGWKMCFESDIAEPCQTKAMSTYKVENSVKQLILDNLCI